MRVPTSCRKNIRQIVHERLQPPVAYLNLSGEGREVDFDECPAICGDQCGG